MPAEEDDGGEAPGLRKIIHVDMDAFFASVEQRDDPALQGKPVAVGGARAAGWWRRRAMRRASSACVRPCPRCGRSSCARTLIFVKPRFEVYRAVSQQIRAIFRHYTPHVEPLSLDEAYLDVTEDLKGSARPPASPS